MQVVVLANDELKEELLSHGVSESINISWVSSPEILVDQEADSYFDLLFDFDDARINLLKQISSKPVFINAVNGTLENLPANFVRINAWPTFLKRAIVEAAADEKIRMKAAEIFTGFNRHVEWVDDIPGMISARVVSMIINEAYFTIDEGVTSKSETDKAMKLGTNYPYGPFDWAQKIGLRKILTLLEELSRVEERYHPSALLKKEATS